MSERQYFTSSVNQNALENFLRALKAYRGRHQENLLAKQVEEALTYLRKARERIDATCELSFSYLNEQLPFVARCDMDLVKKVDR